MQKDNKGVTYVVSMDKAQLGKRREDDTEYITTHGMKDFYTITEIADFNADVMEITVKE
jgi:hypothetical protein